MRPLGTDDGDGLGKESVVDHVLSNGTGCGIQAIVVYPMNALCNSPYGQLEKFQNASTGQGRELVRSDRYTGQDDQFGRDRHRENFSGSLRIPMQKLQCVMITVQRRVKEKQKHQRSRSDSTDHVHGWACFGKSFPGVLPVTQHSAWIARCVNKTEVT